MTPEDENGGVKWASISLPESVLGRVDAIFERLGYTSRAEYVRHATLKQLREDEGAER